MAVRHNAKDSRRTSSSTLNRTSTERHGARPIEPSGGGSAGGRNIVGVPCRGRRRQMSPPVVEWGFAAYQTSRRAKPAPMWSGTGRAWDCGYACPGRPQDASLCIRLSDPAALRIFWRCRGHRTSVWPIRSAHSPAARSVKEVTVVPRPAPALSARMRPPCASTSPLQMASPRPWPAGAPSSPAPACMLTMLGRPAT